MIKRLQRRLTAMVIGVLLVIAVGIVLAINGANLVSIRGRMYASLEILMENEGRRPEGFLFQEDHREPPSGQDRERPEGADFRGARLRGERDQLASLTNSYTVRFDADGALSEWTSDRAELYTDEQIASIAGEIWRRGEGRGRIETQYYALRLTDEGGLAVVVDDRSEMAGVRSLLLSTVVVTALACMALGAGAVLLIRRMLRPVAEAFEKQKQFVWDASHELKTPLAVIAANADVLAGQIGPNEYLGYIRSEVRRTDRLVQNLLTLARLDSGTVRAEKRPFDLGRALLRVALPFESTVFEAGKTLETDVPEGVSCHGDEEMIQQLAVILLSNALKYSDERGRIRLRMRAQGGKRIIEVHNTGEPIAPEAQAHVFDRFYRADSSHNRENQGNGLGLAIARTIVEAHRGRIGVSSAPGEGTTFTVTLPE